MPIIDPNDSERDFHQEAFNIAKKRNSTGSIISGNERRADLAKAYPENLASPRYIHPDKFLEDVQNRYKF